MTQPLRVAVVGAGVIAATHLRVVAARSDVTLVAVVDPVPAARDALVAAAREAGQPAAGFASLGEALAEADVQLVAITTPSSTHADLATTALDAGCHVLVEKPVDTDLARARRLAARAADAARDGRVVSVMTQNRFAPAVRTVRDAVRAGRFGTLTSATATLAWWRSDAYYASAGWRGTWEFDGGGALMNQGVHTVDVLLSLLGRPVTVAGVARTLGHDGLEVEDVAAAVVTFEGGAVATLLATTAAFPGGSTRVQVHGTRGSAHLQDGLLEFLRTDGGTEGEVPAQGAPDDLATAHARQYDDVLAAIGTGRAPESTVEDGLLALAVITAVYQSSALGRPVAVADVLAGVHDGVDHRRTTSEDDRGAGR